MSSFPTGPSTPARATGGWWPALRLRRAAAGGAPRQPHAGVARADADGGAASPSVPTGYRPDIDGLRALAIVPVILFHCAVPGCQAGFVGVDVFFVISGYLITGQILRDLEAGTFSFAGFYARRVRRIVPALGLMAVATLVAGWLWFFPANYRDLGRSAAMLAAFASNVFFWIKAGYFTAPAETKPLLHTWSISIEEQFYLAIPALVWMAWRWRRRGVAAALLASLVASLGVSLRLSAADPDAAFYLIQSRGWELAIGCLAATVPAARIGRFTPAAREAIAAVGLSTVVAALTVTSPVAGWPAPRALLPCLGTAALLVAGEGVPTAVSRLLALPLPVAIGLRSYALYLWHWPFLAFARYVSEAPLSPAEACGIAALSVPVAWASFHFVEQPCRRAAGLAAPRVAMPLALATLGVLAGAGIAVSITDGAAGRRGFTAGAFEADTTAAENRDDLCGAVTDSPTHSGMFCRLGAVANGRPKVLLVGDSFADMYLSALRAASERFDREVWFLRDGRAPLDDRLFEAVRTGSVGDVVIAYSWRRALQAGIPELSARDGSGRARALGYDPASLLRDHRADFRADLTRVVERFAAAGARVFVVEAPPSYPVPVPLKLGLVVRRGGDPASFGMPLADHGAMFAPVHTVFDALAARGLVRCLRPADVLCSAGRCRAWADGHALYSDDAHLSAYGAELVAPIFTAVFTPGR